MKTRNTLRRVLALLCCMAMLLPCVPAALAAEEALFSDDFESYTDDATVGVTWKKGGSTSVNKPKLGTDKALSGKQSLLLEDTESDKSFQASYAVKTSVPMGTEIIVTANYFVEELSGSGTPRLNIHNGQSNFFSTYSTGKWDTMSGIVTTPADNQSINIVLENNTPIAAKTYWDDVKLQVLTEELALQYVEEKLFVPNQEGLSVALNSNALGLVGADEDMFTYYNRGIKKARQEKGSALTKAEIQACVDKVNSGDTGPIFEETFEDYPNDATLTSSWKKGGSTQVNKPKLGDKALSGTKSILIEDTEGNKALQAAYTVKTTVPAGTELIMTAYYYVDSMTGTPAPLINVHNGQSNFFYSYSTGKWDRLSGIVTTPKDNQSINALVVSNSATVAKTYWDNITLNILTEQLAVDYVNEKIAIDGAVSTNDLNLGLHSKALGLIGVQNVPTMELYKSLQAKLKEKGEPLTKLDIQGCVDDLILDALEQELKDSILSIGAVGEISSRVVEMSEVLKSEWVSVSPADKNIKLSNGKATVTAIPTGADDVYSAVLRLSAGSKSVDINYTIRLVNEAGFNVEEVNRAKEELLADTIIAATAASSYSVPKVTVSGVTAQWDRIESDPNSCVEISGGQLAVKSVPTGLDYYEAVAVLKLTKGQASAEVEYTVIAYDKTYRTLLPVINPGFEVVNRFGEPLNWSALNTNIKSYGKGSDEVARTGERSFRFVDGDPNGNYGWRSKNTASPAQAGYEYELTFWAMGTATSEDPLRAGMADYLEYQSASGSKLAQTEGTALPVSATEWTLISQWGEAVANTKYVSHMPYGFVSTVTDLYMDDFLTWEFTPDGSALRTDLLLTDDGDADALFKRLSIDSMGISGVNAENKAEYLTALTAKRADKGSALTKEELAAGVKEVNDKLIAETAATIQKLVSQIKTKQTITKTGVVEVPTVSDSTLTVKFTAVSGTGASRVKLTGLGAKVESLPAFGKKDEKATLVLSLIKGEAKVDVNVELILKAYTKGVDALAKAAKELDITEYLNGQSADCITSDLSALPTELENGISVQWQMLDSATLQPSNAVTAEGKVTRPAYGQADAAVVLRATLSKGGDKFQHDEYIIVAATGVEESRVMVTENAGFEEAPPFNEFTAPDGWIKGKKWTLGKEELLTDYANVVSYTAFTGTQSLRLSGGNQHTTSHGTKDITSNLMNLIDYVVVTAREGYTYTLDVMAYTDHDLAQPAVYLRFWDNFGMQLANVKVNYADVPGGRGVWKNLSISAMAPAGTIMVTAEMEGGTTEGQSYFDNVRVREWPIVPSDSFELGTTGWTTEGTVADGKLTLAAGQSAVSLVRNANRGVTYYLSLEADGGKAALRFVDKDGKTLAEYGKDMKDGLNALYAYAPANTAGVQVVLNGAMTADNVKITRSSNGNNIVDGDFEISANAGVGTIWNLTNATIDAKSGKTGAGLTVKADGKAVSNPIPLETGKTYEFFADVKGKGATMTLTTYNYQNGIMSEFVATSDKDGWNTLTISIPELPEVRNSQPEIHYGILTLSGTAVFDNVATYSVTKNVSNYSVEDIKILPYGTFPFHWSSYGKAATYVANQNGQYTHGVKGLAVDLYGLGEGGVRSSFLQDVKSGKAYEATVNAKGSGAKLTVEFWDKNFNKLGSESVTISSEEFKEYSVIGTAPSGTIYASLAVGGDGVGSVVIDEATLYPVVRSIGTNVQTFIDDWFVADSSNVKRTLYEGESMGSVMQGHGGYPNIHWDEKEQTWKMWHRAGEKLKYRVSKDMIQWSEAMPTYDKLTGQEMEVGGYVHIDDDEPDPNKRYKAVFYDDVGDSVTLSGYKYFYSSDGISWTRALNSKDETYGPTGADVHTLIYDPYNDEYVLTYKNHSRDPLGSITKRDHRVAVSKDLMNWTEGIRMYTVGTPMDTIEQKVIRTDGYGNGIFPMGDSYVSINWRTLLDQDESFGGQLDLNLLFSRDLTEDWQRLEGEDGTAHMAARGGVYGDPDDGQMYSDSGAHIVGDEVWWYIYCESQDHGYDQHPNYAGAIITYLKWRLNGFASMDFSAGGTLTTQQFTMMGSELHLNAKGNLTVELLDASGAVVATGKFSGDSVDAVVTWDKSIADQMGKVVSLRFTSSDAKLYTVQWQGTIFSDVAPDAWYHRAVHYVADNGIMGGYGNGKFEPDENLSRAMVVQMLYNKVGQPKIDGKHGFKDVSAKEWFNNAVTWGTENGVMGGYGNGKFGPSDNVTIEQIAVILWNYSGNPGFNAELGNVGKYSGWAENALTWAIDNGVLYGVNFENATDNATRAQAAQMLTNFLRR